MRCPGRILPQLTGLPARRAVLPTRAPAGVNRSSTHLSLLALYALGGHLVNNQLLPVGVLVTAIGFTFSLVFATQVGGPWVGGGCS